MGVHRAQAMCGYSEKVVLYKPPCRKEEASPEEEASLSTCDAQRLDKEVNLPARASRKK